MVFDRSFHNVREEYEKTRWSSLFQAPRYWGKRELRKRARKKAKGLSATAPIFPDPARLIFAFPF